MEHAKFKKWLFEAEENKKIFYVLVGPPASGKSSWIEDNIESSGKRFSIISRDDIIKSDIFPKYKIANDMFSPTAKPPADAKPGYVDPQKKHYGEATEDEKGRLVYSKVEEARRELEQLLKDQYKKTLSNANNLDYIVIDAMNQNPNVRKNVLSKAPKDYKTVAINFQFKGHEKEIMARSERRAEREKKELGYGFGRSMSEKDYENVFANFVPATKSEGFDEVMTHDSFNKNKVTAESLTRSFRSFLNEAAEQKQFGVVKTGSGLNVNYVLIDTGALIKFYQSLDPQNPDIKKKDLIDNNIVVSAIKIAENTDELKAQYGACMDASHVKVSAVNKNLKGHGYGKLLYKIIMSEHPEGLTPDRDFVSGNATKAWVDMSSSGVKAKNIKDPETGKEIDSFDDINNPKTPTKEDDCVIHPRYDGDPLNKAYIYNGENTQSYMKNAHEALVSCEELIPGGWTVESLEDLLVDAGMSLYDIAIGYEGPLQEARLGKVWQKRAKARARRQERNYTKEDLKWAHKRQQEMHKQHPELEEEYIKQIEHAKSLTDSIKRYLEKLKDIRKQKMEAKGKGGMPPKFGPGTPEKPKGTLPSLDVKNKKGPLSKIRRAVKKAKKYGEETYSGTGYGPAGGISVGAPLEETNNIPTKEEKGDGDN